jgi:hypothetical protein
MERTSGFPARLCLLVYQTTRQHMSVDNTSSAQEPHIARVTIRQIWRFCLGLLYVARQFVQNVALLRDVSVILVASMYKFIIRFIFLDFVFLFLYFICKPAFEKERA